MPDAEDKKANPDPTGEKKERSVANKKKHYNGSGPKDGPTGDEEEIDSDEQGNLDDLHGKRAGKRARRKAKMNEIHGDNSVKDITNESKICKDQGCDKSCGNVHRKPNVARAVAKVAAAQKKKDVVVAGKTVATPSTPKKEALVNGERYINVDVNKSIGYAVAGKNSMNCTFIWQGIVLCAHLFAGVGSAITITCGGVVGTFKKEDFIEIGNDLLFLKSNFVNKVFTKATFLRSSVPVVGEKVKLIAYDSVADEAAGKYRDDSGKVKSIVTTPGEEKAYSSYSSVDGCCGAPVVNVNGKVVGFHNFTTSIDTGFIPVSKTVVSLATGTSSTF
jgi:hypothetical protein